MKFWEHLQALVLTIIEGYDHCKVVVNEEDSDNGHQPEAAEFLKVNGRRVGRDFRLYSMVAMMAPGQMLAQVGEEILIPLQRECPDGFIKALDRVDHFGRIYLDDNEDLERWKAIWRT